MLVIGVTQKPLAATIAFVLLGIPSILAGAYSGLEAVDRRVIDFLLARLGRLLMPWAPTSMSRPKATQTIAVEGGA